jgi:hypothetical protein
MTVCRFSPSRCLFPARVAVLFLLLAVGAGCGSKPAAKSEFVPVAEIQPELVKVAEKALPNVKFENARKIKVNGEDVYEIRGKMPNGKIREVEVSAAGKVVEVE